MNKVQEAKPYRIEWRNRTTGEIPVAVDHDNKEDALRQWERHLRNAYTFGPFGPYRLVLLGPDRTTLPGGAR